MDCDKFTDNKNFNLKNIQSVIYTYIYRKIYKYDTGENKKRSEFG